MASYEVLIISQSVSDLANEIKDFFSVDVVSDIGQARDALVSKAYRAIVVDGLNSSGDLMLACCRDIVALSLPVTPPVVLLTPEYSLDEKIKAFEVGCDD